MLWASQISSANQQNSFMHFTQSTDQSDHKCVCFFFKCSRKIRNNYKQLKMEPEINYKKNYYEESIIFSNPVEKNQGIHFTMQIQVRISVILMILVGSLRWPSWGLLSTLCFQWILDQKTLLNNVVQFNFRVDKRKST